MVVASEVIDAHGSQEQKEMKKRGVLIPDIEINSLMFGHTPKNQKGLFLLLDGYPRTRLQAEGLLHLTEQKYGSSKVITIFLDTPKHEASQRIGKRAQEEDRNDDKGTIPDDRFKYFYDNNPGVIEVLKKGTRFHRVNGLMSPEEIADHVILEILNKELSPSEGGEFGDFKHESPLAQRSRVAIPSFAD